MSMTQTVSVEDLYPRLNARKLDQKLVHELSKSMRLIGYKPSRAITARRDGDIYWIVDGAHRHAAAKLAGISAVPVDVEVLDDADLLTEEGALNLQRPDTEEERWARAQEMLSLGVAVTDAQIEVASGIPAESVPVVRRIHKRMADPIAFVDISLDQALAMDKYAHDAEAFERLRDAGHSWKTVLFDIEREHQSAEAEAALRVWAERHDIPIKAQGGRYIDGCRADNLPDEVPEGTTHVRLSGTVVYFYGELVASEPQPSASMERQFAVTEARERVLAYIAMRLDSLSFTDGQTLKALAARAWECGWMAESAALSGPLADIEGGYNRMLASVLASIAATAMNAMRTGSDDFIDEDEPATIALYAALKAEGYEVSEAEAEALKDLEEATDE